MLQSFFRKKRKESRQCRYIGFGRVLVAEGEGSSITIEEHRELMSVQNSFLLSFVEATRKKKLAAHGIALSNLTQRNLNKQWGVETMMEVLLQTIELKEPSAKRGT